MKFTIFTTLLVTFSYTLFAQSCDLIGHYTFNDQTANDVTNYMNHGTAFKTSTTTDRMGNANQAYLFDGDSSRIDLPTSLLSKQEMTISMWFKTSNDGVLMAHQNVAFYQSGLANWTPILYVRQDGTLHGSFWNGSANNVNDSTFVVNDNTWHHVLITGDASGQSVYIDNVLCGTGSGIQILSNVVYNHIGNSPAGSFWPSTPGGNFPFDGAIDDVLIYNRMMSASEVNDIYNGTPSLFPGNSDGEYSFNRLNADDESGNTNHGTEFKTTTTTDRFGNANQAYMFDGDSSRIDLPTSMLSNQEMAISMWFKTSADGVLMAHQNVAFYQSGLANWTPILYVRQDGQLHASFWNGSASNENDSSFVVNDNTWHHVVITGDATEQSVYIDNVLCGTGTGIQILSNVIYNHIGNSPCGSFWPSTPGGNFPFDGAIDDIRIYSRKLCPDDVNNLFAESDPGNVLGTSFAQIEKVAVFNIFPNPTNNLLNIEIEHIIEQVNIYSLEGRLLKSSTENTVSVSELPTGTYMIQVITEEGLGNKLFIKQ